MEIISKMTEKQKEETLKNFMLEHFCFDTFKKWGVFGKDIKRKDYKKQAERLCHWFGYKNIYEYGTEEIRCHISYAEGQRPTWINDKGELKTEPFVTVTKSWLND
jgi:hypothetical protein